VSLRFVWVRVNPAPLYHHTPLASREATFGADSRSGVRGNYITRSNDGERSWGPGSEHGFARDT